MNFRTPTATSGEHKAGDTVKIQFTGLTNPVEKMSGNYNFNANLYYVGEDGTKFGDGTGGIGVYDFNGNPARQTRTVTIPKYWTGDTYTLTDGAIRMAASAALPAPTAPPPMPRV